MPLETISDLINVFTYRPPDEGQIEKYHEIRAAALGFAEVVMNECPRCADRTAALRKIREAVMTANASIALNGKV